VTTKTTKIVIEFGDLRAAVAWFTEARSDEHLAADSCLYRADALDLSRGGDASTLIVRQHGDRPHGLIRDTTPA
jgi:hypothetical protein